MMIDRPRWGNDEIDAVKDLAGSGRHWYRSATEEQFDAIIDHIRKAHKTHADVVTPKLRALALACVERGDIDGVKVHEDGAKHYLLADLGVTVYVAVNETSYVDMPEKLDAHWQSIIAYRVVDKDRHAQKTHATMPGQAVVDVDVY